MKQLYYSFTYPCLTYAITSWGSACKTRLNRIRTKENKCIRLIFFAHSRENATSYYNLLDILKLDNILKLKVALFAHNIINDPTGIPKIYSRELYLQLPTAVLEIIESLWRENPSHDLKTELFVRTVQSFGDVELNKCVD